MVALLEGNETILYLKDLERERDELKELLRDTTSQLHTTKVCLKCYITSISIIY